jgi:hypothetical protein
VLISFSSGIIKLSGEILPLSGTGYSSLILKRFTLEKEGRISAFIIDETTVQIGGRNEVWLWMQLNQSIAQF